MYQIILWVELLILFAMRDLEWSGLNKLFVQLMVFGASNPQFVIVRSSFFVCMLMVSLAAVCSMNAVLNFTIVMFPPTGVCGPLKQVLNSTLTVDSHFYNGKATYQCNEGFNFKFSGSQAESRLTYCCLHDDNSDHLLEWVGDYDVVPDCERK